MDFQRYAASLRSRLHGGAVRPAVAVGAAVVLLVVLGAAVWHLTNAAAGPSFEMERAEAMQEEQAEPAAQVAVYVSGQVAAPGLYYLDEGARVADAVAKAGGFAEGAVQDALNLARVLVDGEQVDVPSRAEMEAAAGAAGSAGQGAAGAGGQAASGRVNINTADAAALQSLDGIGEATAAKIIADRQANGPFKTVDDLKRVAGIGDKKLAALRDAICV